MVLVVPLVQWFHSGSAGYSGSVFSGSALVVTGS